MNIGVGNIHHRDTAAAVHTAAGFDGEAALTQTALADDEVEMEDAYRFPPILTDLDLYLLGEGTHLELYHKLGAHLRTVAGVKGVIHMYDLPNGCSVYRGYLRF